MESSAAEFDLHQPSTLFWKNVPISVRRDAKDERSQGLTVRLIAGFQRANHSQRVLRVYISSEADAFFLYVLEVNEDDFAALKLDQGILVDFANFPGKIIGLLEKCIACRGEELPRFQAVLQTSGGQGSFKLVETNDFKQLPHITLLFRPGNDGAVKQFLAFRLSELSMDCQQLSSQLGEAQSERNALQMALTETKRALASTREQHDKHVLECEAELKGREALLAEAKAHELAALREQYLRERTEAERKWQEATEAAQARTTELDTDNRALRQHKYELDTRVSELSHKLGAAEGANRSLTEEVERLRVLTQQLGRDKAERDVEIGEALTKVHALEDKVDTQKEVIAEQADRIRGMEASLRQVEARAEELKAAAQGHEERAREAASEVSKANTIIEKLSNDLQMSREKMRRKAAIISRQEEEVQQREQALDESRQQGRTLQRELDKARDDAESLRREVEELRRKLEDSKKQLQGNEQMIRWLNNQITESQLHYGGSSGLASTRYTFRPSAPAPSVLSAGTGGGSGGAMRSMLSAGGGGNGSTLSTGAAPSLSLGVSTYRSPAMPVSSDAAGGLGAAPSTGGSSYLQGTAGSAGMGGITPTSAVASGGGNAPLSAPGTGGSGYTQSSIYTGGTGYSGYSGGYARQGGTASNAAMPAARSLNLGGLGLGATSSSMTDGGPGGVPGQASSQYRSGDARPALPLVAGAH